MRAAEPAARSERGASRRREADRGGRTSGEADPHGELSERSLCGWGRIAPSRALVSEPRDPRGIADALAASRSQGRGVIARGAGRSYGDAAQNGGGRVLDMTGLREIGAIDPRRRSVTVQAGVSLAALMARLARDGLTLPVLPGTRHVTVGGAIASDIHGKSHHRDGAFGRHVRSIELCLPSGDLVEASPESERELFEATLGGMGLTGVIARATLAVEPLPSPWVAADTDRTQDIDETLALLSGPERSRWSVAWLDLLAGGPRMGRALVSRADPWPAEPVAAAHEETSGGASRPRGGARGLRKGASARTGPELRLSEKPRVQAPPWIPSGALRPSLVRAFNAARWRLAPRSQRARRTGLAQYLFPLDALGSWSRLYGRQGLVQYQLVTPPGQEDRLVRCIELLRARRLPVYLAVLKRFGAFASGPLSFPIEGFTLAIDLPGAAPGLRAALDELDEIVAGCGGRVYLTKDIRLRKDVLPTMYPRLDEFLAVRARVDPDGVLRSDLGRRLGLCGDGLGPAGRRDDRGRA